jgi:hypothetical protein
MGLGVNLSDTWSRKALGGHQDRPQIVSSFNSCPPRSDEGGKSCSNASAIRESFKLTRGHTETILLLCIVGGATFLVGGLLALLGTSPALVWWHLSMASLYHATVTPPTGWQIEDAEELEHQKNLPEE